MNQGQFKDPLCYLCLGGTVVPPLSLTEEVVSYSPHLKKKKKLSLNSVTVIWEKLQQIACNGWV